MRPVPAALLSALVLSTLLIGCARLDAAAPTPPAAEPVAPPAEPLAEAPRFDLPDPRPARPSNPGLAQHAQRTFWDAFYGGRYEALDQVTMLLTAAYLENPRDAAVTLLLAHAHLWRVAERRRLGQNDPTVTDHLALAEAYFEEAYRLAPEDHRIIGWLGSVRMPLGGLRQDSAFAQAGYDLLQEATRRYPAFNHFTAGFALSGLPADDPRYAEGVEHVWANVEQCSGSREDAPAGSLSPYEAALQTDPVCANTEKAPHNYEGFMLNLGDMLVKAGEPAKARAVYARAELSPTYADWPYRDKLEQRMLGADEAAALFARAGTADGAEMPEMLFGSAYACAACHQR